MFQSKLVILSFKFPTPEFSILVIDFNFYYIIQIRKLGIIFYFISTKFSLCSKSA